MSETETSTSFSATTQTSSSVSATMAAVVTDTFTISAGSSLNTSSVDGILANDVPGLSVLPGTYVGLYGNLTVFPDGSFIYEPSDPNISGLEEFTPTLVEDSTGRTVNSTLWIHILPVARPNSYETLAGLTLNISSGSGVLGEDAGTGLAVWNETLSSSNGTLVLFDDGGFSFIPVSGFSGIARFNYTAVDALGQNATAELTIYVLPAAYPDAYTTSANESLSIASIGGLLINDVGTLLAVVAETFVVSEGKMEVGIDGSFLWTPSSPGLSGNVTFVYKILDADGQEANSTVTLTILPVAKSDLYSSSSLTLETNATSGLLVNDLGTSLTATSTNVNTSNGGCVNVYSDGSFNYTAIGSGIDVFGYEVIDAFGQTATGSATITVSFLQADLPTRTSSTSKSESSSSLSQTTSVSTSSLSETRTTTSKSATSSTRSQTATTTSFTSSSQSRTLTSTTQSRTSSTSSQSTSTSRTKSTSISHTTTTASASTNSKTTFTSALGCKSPEEPCSSDSDW